MGRALLLAGLLALCCAPYTQAIGLRPHLGLSERAGAGEAGAQGVRDAPEQSSSLPVVLWHGMGDSCCAAGSMGAVRSAIEEELGVFVHSVATGDGEYHDIWSSFMGSVNAQVDKVCGSLAGMPELEGGFNMVGFSQGGQFLRAVVERCGHKLPPVHTLITLGGQHQGVMNTPGCTQGSAGTGWAAKACSVMQMLLGRGAYAPWVRENVIQAQYFKDPDNLEAYLANSAFLAEINNERGDKDARYAQNLAALERLVLYRFEDDSTVVPRDSAWFSFYNGTDLVPLCEQDIYTEDWIGLRQIGERGGLFFESAPGEHMQFTLEWFREEVVRRWLGGEPSQRRRG